MKNNLKEIRCAKKLTQKEVCDELQKHNCYICRSAYAKYESGVRNISCENLCAIAKVLETSIDKILGI